MMVEGTLALAAEMMRGTLYGADDRFHGISTDTRTLREGELFFALRGPQFDGASFLEAAAARRAGGAVVHEATAGGLPNIVVDDTRVALGALASQWRAQLPVRIIGITGSNGKTTLKEMIAACLSISDTTLATRGNLNNDIGMPLMLSELDHEHRYAVLEMGANHAGEIAYLAGLARPEIVAITNAAPAHLEGFGSLEDVAQAKGEILVGEPRPRVAVLNADDRFFPYWRSMAAESEVIAFGEHPEADVRFRDLHEHAAGTQFTLITPQEEIDVALPLAGRHNVFNACAAAAIGVALDLDGDQIRDGLQTVETVSGRLQAVTSASGAALYDDSYNANPVSVVAAAEFLAARPGRTWLVLGDMAELGADAAALHASVGEAAKKAGIDRLFATGELSRHTVSAFGDDGSWFATIDELIAELAAGLDAGTSVLVKGSRSMQMERVVAALQGQPVASGGAS